MNISVQAHRSTPHNGPHDKQVMLNVVVFCAFLFIVYKSFYLLYPDLAFTYPFVSFDGFQWLADGLYSAGHNLESTYRNPGLPLVVALLNNLGILNALPIVHAALLGIFFMYLTRFLRLFFPVEAVALTILFLFFNFKVQTFFDYILADPWAVTLQLVSMFYLYKAESNPRMLVPAYLAAGLSFMFQYAVAFTFPVYLVHAYELLKSHRHSGKQKVAYLSAAVLLVLTIVLPNFVYRWITFGNPLYSKVVHFELVVPHFFASIYYGFGFFSFFGIPAAVAIIIGFFAGLREKGVVSLIYLQALCYVVFWVFLYAWHDVRFILYMLPCCAFFLAYCVDRFKIAGWYAWRDAPLQRKIVAYAILPLLLSFGFHHQGGPFTSNLLPLTPQAELVLANEPITSWPGNETINLTTMHIRYHTEIADMPGFSFLAHYWYLRNNVNPVALTEYKELSRIHALSQAACGEAYRIRSAGTLSTDYTSVMRRKLTLHREVEPTYAAAQLVLVRPADPATGTVLFSGEYYKLCRL